MASIKSYRIFIDSKLFKVAFAILRHLGVLAFSSALICSTLLPPKPMSLFSIGSIITTVRSLGRLYFVLKSSVMSAINCSFCALGNSGLVSFIVTIGIMRPFFKLKQKQKF